MTDIDAELEKMEQMLSSRGWTSVPDKDFKRWFCPQHQGGTQHCASSYIQDYSRDNR